MLWDGLHPMGFILWGGLHAVGWGGSSGALLHWGGSAGAGIRRVWIGNGKATGVTASCCPAREVQGELPRGTPGAALCWASAVFGTSSVLSVATTWKTQSFSVCFTCQCGSKQPHDPTVFPPLNSSAHPEAAYTGIWP